MTPRRRILRLAGDAARCVGARVPAAASGARAAAARGAGAVARSDVRHVGCRPISPAWTRGFAASGSEPLTEDALKKRMDEINDAFTEARDEIESAMEAVGTTYFNEDAEIAKECVEQTLALYYALCDELDEETKGKTQRAMGMKMEQLKAEWSQVEHAHDDH
jgi:hypothetical protein